MWVIGNVMVSLAIQKSSKLFVAQVVKAINRYSVPP